MTSRGKGPSWEPDARHREMVEEFHRVYPLYRRIRKLTARSRRLLVCEATLTFRTWARVDWVFVAVHWLANEVLEEGECLLLVLDWRAKKKRRDNHLHWQGLFLLRSKSRMKEVLSEWRRRTHTSWKGLRCHLVRGQDGDRSGAYYRDSLSRYIDYFCKRPAEMLLTLRERTVATGALEECWRDVFGTAPQGPYALVQIHRGTVRPGSVGDGVRLCRDCGKPLPGDYPANKWYHEETCSRQRRYAREKKTTMKQSSSRPRDHDSVIAHLVSPPPVPSR